MYELLQLTEADQFWCLVRNLDGILLLVEMHLILRTATKLVYSLGPSPASVLYILYVVSRTGTHKPMRVQKYAYFLTDTLRLAALHAGIRLAGFTRVRDKLARLYRGRGERLDQAAAVARSAHCNAALRRFPLKSNCQHRSLLRYWVLRKGDLEAQVRVGLRKESGVLAGHAWVEHGGLPLHEPAGMVEQHTDASVWLDGWAAR